jgi:hypothetical protein
LFSINCRIIMRMFSGIHIRVIEQFNSSALCIIELI